MELIFDTHAHYDDAAFQEDRKEILSGLSEHGVGQVVDVSAALSGIPDVIALARAYEYVYAAVGVHPTETYELETNDIQKVEQYAADPANKVVAIGEIGLDFYYGTDDRDEQQELFRKQIRLANELRMPIMIHSRDANQLTMDILTEEGAFSEERKS